MEKLRPVSEYFPGMRIVSARDTRYGFNNISGYESVRIERVVSVDERAVKLGHNTRVMIENDEGQREIIVGRTSIIENYKEDKGWKVVYTEDLPEDDNVAIAYVKNATRRSSGKPALIWLAAKVSDNTFYAHNLYDTTSENINILGTDGLFYSDRPFLITINGNEMDKPKEEIHVGDVVCGFLGKACKERGVYHHSMNAGRVIYKAESVDKAANVIPCKKGIGYSGILAGDYDVTEREEIAEACSEKSEGLLLAWRDGDAKDLSLSFMGTSGIAFWRNDDPEIYAEQSVPGEGLWVWENVTYSSYRSYEGEYDADMEGDWKPATAEDITRLLGHQWNAEEEIRAIMDLPSTLSGDDDNNEESLVLKYQELAKIAMEQG
jgi:hypothetical protein